MCPSRFLPLYKLFHLYKTNGEKERSLAMAEAVISKPMKIKTTTIRMMKREMERERTKNEYVYKTRMNMELIRLLSITSLVHLGIYGLFIV